MEENLADTLQRAADVMHWFGQYRVSNALVLLGRFVRLKGLYTLDRLEAFVIAEEEIADVDAETLEGVPEKGGDHG